MSAGVRWWEGAVLYTVYVRSWQDTDGDGSGDLAGVRRRLDHLSWLGVDGIWLSPINPSADEDWGYDVTGYTAVHPDLGDLGDLDRLVSDAADRGIRVVLDLVPNHTSSAHPWFVEARSGRGAKRREWYVWVDADPSGGAPNNWLDSTGRPAWTLDEASGQYYLHNFLPAQPDLNWWNDEVHREFEHILRFWFDRGVAGFRIDVAHALYHDRELGDDPPAPVGPGARFGLAPARSMNRPEVHQVYRDWRKLAEDYQPPRLLLGETWVLDTGRMAAFYGGDDELQLAFNFSLVFSPFTAPDLSRVVAATLADLPPGGCPVWTGSNHDIPRFPTRWAEGDPRRARLALVVLCTLPGAAVLYYGDELGLTDVDVAPGARRDKMTWRSQGGRFNRDRARTPMPWEPGPNGGFTSGWAAPWLPLGDRSGVSVAEQLADPDSTLWFTRRLLEVRRQAFQGTVATYEQLPSGPDQWVYRSGPLVVACNFSARPCVVSAGDGRLLLSTAGTQAGPAGGAGAVTAPAGGADGQPLRPWEAIIVKPEAATAHGRAGGGSHGNH